MHFAHYQAKFQCWCFLRIGLCFIARTKWMMLTEDKNSPTMHHINFIILPCPCASSNHAFCNFLWIYMIDIWTWCIRNCKTSMFIWSPHLGIYIYIYIYMRYFIVWPVCMLVVIMRKSRYGLFILRSSVTQNCIQHSYIKGTQDECKAVSTLRWYLSGIEILIIIISWSHDHLVFVIGIPIPGKTVFILKLVPVFFL